MIHSTIRVAILSCVFCACRSPGNTSATDAGPSDAGLVTMDAAPTEVAESVERSLQDQFKLPFAADITGFRMDITKGDCVYGITFQTLGPPHGPRVEFHGYSEGPDKKKPCEPKVDQPAELGQLYAAARALVGPSLPAAPVEIAAPALRQPTGIGQFAERFALGFPVEIMEIDVTARDASCPLTLSLWKNSMNFEYPDAEKACLANAARLVDRAPELYRVASELRGRDREISLFVPLEDLPSVLEKYMPALNKLGQKKLKSVKVSHDEIQQILMDSKGFEFYRPFADAIGYDFKDVFVEKLMVLEIHSLTGIDASAYGKKDVVLIPGMTRLTLIKK